MTISRLERLKQKETRRLWAVILGGKMLGLVGVLGAMAGFTYFVNTPAGASPLQEGPSTEVLINSTNTVWVLVAAFLVFFMQAGFMALEAGFARSRESVNIMMECIVDTCLCGILFWAFGFAFMFGTGNGFIGHEFFFLNGAPPAYGTTGVAFMAFFLFQFAFADTTSTITSGAMVGRTSFKGDLFYSFAVSGFIYPIVGHWIWGPGGWLGNMTPSFLNDLTDGAVFRDFAGSTVVHTVGGMVALWGAIALGPRIGRKFKSEGGGPTAPHDLNIAAIGAVILWFGWYGFNPGSTLSALDAEGIGRVATNTTLAAAAGGLMAMAFVYPRAKKWDLGMTINGFLGGLVAITAPCYWVNSTGAVLIGATAGVLVPLGVDLLERLKIDDPIGAVAVHGFVGIWGTLSIGLFATGQFGIPGSTGADVSGGTVEGLFWGGGSSQLIAQAIGSVSAIAAVSAASAALFYGLKAFKSLRVEEDGELEGIDIFEHGTPAYHVEFGHGMTYSAPLGSASPVVPDNGEEVELPETEVVASS